MTTSTFKVPRQGGLSKKEFNRLSAFIEAKSGIQMPESKISMLTARIQKRLRMLKMHSFAEYVDLIMDPKDATGELVHFIDLVTTNKTDFFREPAHFDFMRQTAFADLAQRTGAGINRPLQIWSAPCSTGEEPYTMAMVVLEYAELHQGRFRAQILGTDLSTKALNIAKKAIYSLDKAEPVSLKLKKKYMLRGKDRKNPQARMSAQVRAMVRYQNLNFMDATYNVPGTMDIIFCRNCLIYFDRDTAAQIVNKLCRHLVPGGYFFVGHSETLNQLDVPLVQVAPTIYQLPED